MYKLEKIFDVNNKEIYLSENTIEEILIIRENLKLYPITKKEEIIGILKINVYYPIYVFLLKLKLIVIKFVLGIEK